MTQWLDGNAIAGEIREETRVEVKRLYERGIRPGLAVVLVGEDPASQVYVRAKVKTCGDLGMHSERVEMPSSASTEQILEVVRGLNLRKDIHGILVQVPLPPRVDARCVLNSILPEKDVDGFHPENVGRLVSGNAVLKPCTPAGIMEILRRSAIPVRGQHAVVIGRSDIVGKPVALMMVHADATVTVCHSKTQDLPGIASTADILVVAMGRAAFVDDTFVKPGSTVIDVGVNRVSSEERIRDLFDNDPGRLTDIAKKGYTLVGDVHPRKVFGRCAYLTPVPGGVGPLTIAMLMGNTTKAAALQARAPDAFPEGAAR